MKWLLIFFLLANVIYFGWELDRQTKMDISHSASLPEIPQNTRRLQFLEELETSPPLRNTEIENPLDTFSVLTMSLQEQAQNDENLAGAEAMAELIEKPSFDSDMSEFETEQVLDACFTFGPVADENQAIALQNWFTANTGQAFKRYTDEQGRQLFWVYLSPKQSREEAMATIRSFENKDVRDFRLIVKGNLQNAISMGLFSSQASVNKRLSELKKKGLKPVVVPYADGKRVFWIDAMLPDDEIILDKVFRQYPSKFSSLPIKCEEIAIEADYS